MNKMTTVLLAALTVSSISQAAGTCRSTTLVLHPSKDNQALCNTLRLSGPVQLVTCTSGEAIFKSSALEVALTKVEGGFVSNSTYIDDEDRSVSVSELNLNLKARTFTSRDVTTDRRGHVRSNATCTGTLGL